MKALHFSQKREAPADYGLFLGLGGGYSTPNMHAWMDGGMDGRKEGGREVCSCVCVYIYVYIYMYYVNNEKKEPNGPQG